MNDKIKLLIAGAAACLTISTEAANWQYDSLLGGYNVDIASNTVATAIGQTSTNVLYTSLQGQVLYSLTNNYVNGVLNTNSIAGDAFSLAFLKSDANGDVVANAALVISIGNTNLIPPVVTNSVGQWFVTNWVINPQVYPGYMYPATTNYYPQYVAADTNVITISLYRAVNSYGPPSNPTYVWDTTSGFTTTFMATGLTPLTLNTNLPIAWTQGASAVKAVISMPPNVNNNGGHVLLNFLGISQPIP